MGYTPRLKEKFEKEIKANLAKEFGYTTPMAIPVIEKIAINQGIGDGITDKKLVDKAVEELTLLTGQKAVHTYSRKDISNFKLRKGMAIGARVTLRGNIMYEFLDRLTAIAMPRIRDFRGMNEKGFDGFGNYTFGVPEQIIFPEISLETVAKLNGLNITFVTSAKTDKECYALLKEFGFPFKNANK